MRPVRIGTDCSGMDAPIEALIQLQIPFIHVFSSDINKYCRQTIRANSNPPLIFQDLAVRDHAKLPDIDWYICGFPCQAFSIAGKQHGFQDDRGNVIFDCIETIRCKQPKVFILENVKHILSHDTGNTFKVIEELLSDLPGYKVNWKVLNTRKYGIPQNRERVYIVGIRDLHKSSFEFPLEIPLYTSLFNIIDFSNVQSCDPPPSTRVMLSRAPKDSLFVDLSFKRKRRNPNSGTFTTCLAAKSQFWCVPLSRPATILELRTLQGFNDEFKQVVSDSQFRYQLGNTMSVNVLKHLFQSILIYS
jgi:DNA (cytosine-5)-methyltransferase 1